MAIGPQTQTPNLDEVGRLTDRALAMTYFLTGNPQYHRRGVVSRSCSGWEGVGPTRYGRQEFWNFWKEVVGTGLCIASCGARHTLSRLVSRVSHFNRKVIESSRTGN